MEHPTLAKQLREALDRPLTMPGSSALAQQALARFGQLDALTFFATKAEMTLADGLRHDCAMVTPTAPRVAVSFVAWPGTHREVQVERLGQYLNQMYALATRLGKSGIPLAGLLEIDAYLRKDTAGNLEVDVEFAHMPGALFGTSGDDLGNWPQLVMLNPDLCTREERQALERVEASMASRT